MNLIFRCLAFFFLTTLMVLATIRSNGLDFEVYLREFKDPINSLSSQEVGYVALITFIGKFAGFWLVLLVANVVFFICHLPLWDRMKTATQSTAMVLYLTYVGLFLVYGSPRRLIAYSVVAYLIQKIVLEPPDIKKRRLLYMLLVLLAACFHASALIFLPVLIGYAYGRALFNSPAKLLAMIAGVIVFAGALYVTGVIDYLILKITYYVYYAAGEQEYLEEVPSVTSGLLKRGVAFGLLWFGTRQSPELRRPVLDFCVIEAFVYGSLGSLSPVLGVTASYFALGYLLPALVIRACGESLSIRSLAFAGAAIIYFLPTSIGLIRQFGDLYVP